MQSSDNGQQTPIALVPCNGLSARGRITSQVANLIREQMEDIIIVDLVPLMAEIPSAVENIKRARKVVALAGCSYQCEQSSCHKQLGQKPELSIVIADVLREEVRAADEMEESEMQESVQKATSLLLGKISSL